MSIEITEDFISEQGLTPEQVTAITTTVRSHYADEIAELKKGWDGKANADAEGILSGAAKSISSKLGVEREQGEKMADYIARATDKTNESLSSELLKSKTDYEDKIKNFKGDEATKSELEDALIKLDSLQKMEVEFNSIKEKAEKYDPLNEDYSKMKVEVAFSQVKPSFPDSVNPYESSAIWGKSRDRIMAENHIEVIDGKAKYVSKENKHDSGDLQDLIDKDKEVQDLMKGREQNGIPVSQVGKASSIEGVPFAVVKGMTSKDRQKLIETELLKKYSLLSDDFANEFSRINTLIINNEKQQTA